MESTDTIVNSIIQKFLQRSNLGKQKYGVTLDRTDLEPHDWIQHAQEELMDAILYLEKLKKEKVPPPCKECNGTGKDRTVPHWDCITCKHKV